MICQVKIDEARYVTNYCMGDGGIEGGIDLPPEAFWSADTEKMGACRLSEDGQTLIFDPDRWAEIQARIQQELENPPPSAEARLEALEALYLESILGGAL